MLALLPDALVIRTSAFFGPCDEHNFLAHLFYTLDRGQTFRAACDEVVSPTYVPDLVHASLDLLLDQEHGIWHLANNGAVSWYDFAIRAAIGSGRRLDLVTPVSADRACPPTRQRGCEKGADGAANSSTADARMDVTTGTAADAPTTAVVAARTAAIATKPPRPETSLSAWPWGVASKPMNVRSLETMRCNRVSWPGGNYGRASRESKVPIYPECERMVVTPVSERYSAKTRILREQIVHE